MIQNIECRETYYFCCIFVCFMIVLCQMIYHDYFSWYDILRTFMYICSWLLVMLNTSRFLHMKLTKNVFHVYVSYQGYYYYHCNIESYSCTIGGHIIFNTFFDSNWKKAKWTIKLSCMFRTHCANYFIYVIFCIIIVVAHLESKLQRPQNLIIWIK